jgi:excisionase family DNA binding protein
LVLRRRKHMDTGSRMQGQESGSEEHRMREWITLRELQDLLGIGSTKAYELVSSGEVPSVRIGRAIRINRQHLADWLDRQSYPQVGR